MTQDDNILNYLFLRQNNQYARRIAAPVVSEVE